ncbi:MAG: acetyl-CoA carboxylase carboxyltransferase subunit beta [Syntrophomonadaceae bacterium]|jgi:acetyl-CoA carboxylase carboxyl transferase subunit beta|nr:acetyl-CoA carboxylase carboxyltransferase subunit beta [Syntrophomonadaceae bacterium]
MLKSSFGKQKLIPIPGSGRGPLDKTVPNEPGLKCPSCSRRVMEMELKEHKLCPHCGHHFPLNARERLEIIADSGSFQEFEVGLRSINTLEFPGYDEKMTQAINETGLSEAIITGKATVGGYPCVLGIMDPGFMMGSMGSVVGEKVCRAMERAIELKIALIIFTASGGARMQEGMLSLLQMAKTTAVLGRFHQEGLLYISIITNPTTGGVSASFASLADIILAEPGALIGFAGPRVIKQTISETLPAGFQKAEFMLGHGMLDCIVERGQLKKTLELFLRLHGGEKNG